MKAFLKSFSLLLLVATLNGVRSSPCPFYQELKVVKYLSNRGHVINETEICEDKEIMKGAIVLTTSGRAAEYQGGYFGIYVPVPYPVSSNLAYKAYQQLTLDGNSTKYMKYIFRTPGPNGTWYVGDSLGSRGPGSVFLYNDDTDVNIPKSGWEFYVPEMPGSPGYWDNDCQMEAKNLSEMDPNSMCEKVKIALKKRRGSCNTGEEDWLQQYLGEYVATDAYYVEGRLDYLSSKGKFLTLDWVDRFNWRICDDEYSAYCPIHSAGSANSLNPADYRAAINTRLELSGWGYEDADQNNEWVDLQLSVTCID